MGFISILRAPACRELKDTESTEIPVQDHEHLARNASLKAKDKFATTGFCNESE